MAIGWQHSHGLSQFSSVYVVLYTDETKELECQRHSWSACYVVLLYKMKKKKHCGHQYIKVIHKVTIYLGPNLILRSLNVPSPKFECGWKVGEIGYYLTKLGISSQHLHHLSWWQDLISRWRVQATEQWRHSYGKLPPQDYMHTFKYATKNLGGCYVLVLAVIIYKARCCCKFSPKKARNRRIANWVS